MISSHQNILFTLAFLLCSAIVALAQDQREFRVINAANGLADNSAQVVTCTKTGRMIISTIGNLNFYDGTTFSHIDTRSEYQLQLPLYHGNYHLYFDRHHHLWLKSTNSVTCVNMTMEQFEPDPESVIKQLGCDERVLDLFADQNNHLWVLTEKGLYGIDHKQYYKVLKDRNLQDVEVMDGLLLTFYDNGEEMGIDLNTGRIAHRTKAYEWADAQKYTRTSVLSPYKNGFLQIRNGEQEAILMRFDVKTKQWQTLLETPYNLNNIAQWNDKVYVASAYGYWVIDPATGEQQHVETLKLMNQDKELLTDCNTLAFDKQGGMWIGTEKRGVLYARPYVSPFRVYTWDDKEAVAYAEMMESQTQNINEFNGKKANCMFTDSRGWSWFGTNTGLYLYRSPKSEPVVFNKKSGLLNDVIHSVVEDKNHDIWLSTSCGISCIMFEGEKIVFINSFDEDDKVPNESFANCKAKCLDDGTIIMQALDHVLAFQPDNFRFVNERDTMTFYPKLVKIIVNGTTVTPGMEISGNVVIDRAVTRAREINLNADQTSVMLLFSGLNYFRPLQTYYRVRKKGIDDDWHIYSYMYGSDCVDTNGQLHLLLIGMEPGDFEIEIQASMFPDIWPGEPFVWTVHVNQPWWQATRNYIFVFVIALVLLIVNFLLFNRNTRLRMLRNNEESEIIGKIQSFVRRCDTLSHEPIAPVHDDGNGKNSGDTLSPAFVELMLKLLPWLQEHQDKGLTVHKLCEVGDIDVVDLYEIMNNNLYKSPSELLLKLRLKKAADMLRHTDLTLEQIAAECGFYTPNFFMGNFFHQYKLTPREYREEYK